MKKLSMVFTIVLIICTYLSSSVFALTVTPVYNGATGDLTLSGNAEGIVSIRITPDATSDGELSKDKLPS